VFEAGPVRLHALVKNCNAHQFRLLLNSTFLFRRLIWIATKKLYCLIDRFFLFLGRLKVWKLFKRLQLFYLTPIWLWTVTQTQQNVWKLAGVYLVDNIHQPTIVNFIKPWKTWQMFEQNNRQICVVLQTKNQLRHQFNTLVYHFANWVQSLRVHVQLAAFW